MELSASYELLGQSRASIALRIDRAKACASITAAELKRLDVIAEVVGVLDPGPIAATQPVPPALIAQSDQMIEDGRSATLADRCGVRADILWTNIFQKLQHYQNQRWPEEWPLTETYVELGQAQATIIFRTYTKSL